MKNIQVKVLNPYAVQDAAKMMVAAARLTQRGHNIKNLEDFEALLEKPVSDTGKTAMSLLPHPTIQKFACINVVVVGASRRFLAQITRHQNEVKFMSASLQYSDYSGKADFAVPYCLLNNADLTYNYLLNCECQASAYKNLIEDGADNDSAGYMMPQGLRNVLIISATPYQWKHMIHQRTCRRNTDETRIVMLEIWEKLYELDSILFAPESAGPFCQQGTCKEGKMRCGKAIDRTMTPRDILMSDYPRLFEED